MSEEVKLENVAFQVVPSDSGPCGKNCHSHDPINNAPRLREKIGLPHPPPNS